MLNTRYFGRGSTWACCPQKSVYDVTDTRPSATAANLVRQLPHATYVLIGTQKSVVAFSDWKVYCLPSARFLKTLNKTSFRRSPLENLTVFTYSYSSIPPFFPFENLTVSIYNYSSIFPFSLLPKSMVTITLSRKSDEVLPAFSVPELVWEWGSV